MIGFDVGYTSAKEETRSPSRERTWMAPASPGRMPWMSYTRLGWAGTTIRHQQGKHDASPAPDRGEGARTVPFSQRRHRPPEPGIPVQTITEHLSVDCHTPA
jgi:hypothetical protein